MVVVHADSIQLGGFFAFRVLVGKVAVVQRADSLAKYLSHVTLLAMPVSRLVLNNQNEVARLALDHRGIGHCCPTITPTGTESAALSRKLLLPHSWAKTRSFGERVDIAFGYRHASLFLGVLGLRRLV